jgi:hypothetical protein
MDPLARSIQEVKTLWKGFVEYIYFGTCGATGGLSWRAYSPQETTTGEPAVAPDPCFLQRPFKGNTAIAT